MDAYAALKTLHILSATVLFGTGLGIAFFFWSARAADDQARLQAARTTVRADLIFTAPAAIIQPLSGAVLIWWAGLDWTDLWLTGTYLLYLVAGLCWLPVVWLQWRMMRMLEDKVAGRMFDASHYERLFRWWFALGWPAFLGLVIVFGLMVAKPSW